MCSGMESSHEYVEFAPERSQLARVEPAPAPPVWAAVMAIAVALGLGLSLALPPANTLVGGAGQKQIDARLGR